ncbi:MAG: thioredoxin family protein, partial [Bacteroidales bacterium]|nr:thioredoxin family protein [Bacteroidales bacterium]
YKSEEFNIISVSLDDDRASWLKAIKTYGMQWTNVSDLKRWNSIMVMLYGLEYIPQNILVDKQGRVIAKNISYTDLNQRLLLMLMKQK